jgi:uncharacterized protein (TIGR03545 family)
VVSFDTAVATLQPFPLLLGKAIIPDVKLTGVAMGTSRSQSGAIGPESSEPEEVKASSEESAPKEEQAEQTNDSANKALPSADEILEREELLTVVNGEAFEGAYKKHKTTIDESVANLPSEKAIKEYQTKLNKILKGKFKSLDDFKQRKKDLDQLRAQFKQDKAAISAAKKAIKDGKSNTKSFFPFHISCDRSNQSLNLLM